jgi:hypothetical protein
MIALASKVKVLFWVLAIGGVGLGAISADAQADIHNGPVAIRPMVTAPQLVGKTPPIPPRCSAERAQLREALQAALQESKDKGQRPEDIRARWRAADKALAASTNVMDDGHSPTYCDEALQWASEYVLGN